MAKNTELKFIENNSINFQEYKKLFESIGRSKTKEQLEEVAKDYKINLDNTKYPRLNFKITKSEIDELKNSKSLCINERGVLTIKQDDLSPISKLLYSLVWKQGDIQKLKLIIKGIEEVENPKLDNIERFVFYCFGNHLANSKEYPIIDQHVIRAYNLYCANSNFDFIRKSDKVTANDREKYLIWFQEFKNVDSEFLYLLDRILFEIGKVVKI